MFTRIPHSTHEIITGQQTAAKYLKMQTRLGWLYFRNFFGVLTRQHKTGRFLEIGSGSGYQTAQIARKFPGVEIVAVEPSADMIAAATAYISQQGLSDRVRFVQGTVEDPALISSLGKFDLIYSTFSLHHWRDPACALQNLYDGLKPDGTLLIYDFQRLWLTYHLPLSRGLRESIRAAYTPAELEQILNRMTDCDSLVRTDFPYLYIQLTRRGGPVAVAGNGVRPLDELKGGQSGQIVAIAQNARQSQPLTALGVVQSAFVRVIDNQVHHVMFRVDGRKVAVDKDVAAGIAIRIR